MASEVIGPKTSGKRIAVIEWQAWDGFLLRYVLGNNVMRVETDPFREFPAEQFDRICDSCATVCFQVNLSVKSQLPLQIRNLTNRFKERGLYVVNGLAQDVRKSTLHKHLEAIGLSSLRADRYGAPDEILFVKTDLNYGGELEGWLPRESLIIGGLEHLVSAEFGAYRYKTIERGMLQEYQWTDPSLVIEKYVTNSEDSFFRVYFSGKQLIIVKAFAPGTIKKLSDDPRDTNFVTDVEHAKDGTDKLEISVQLKRDVATFVENTPVEFGCLDFVHDGYDNHYIVDLNLTPYGGPKESDTFLAKFLRLGITNPDRRKLSGFLNSPLVG